MRVSVRGEVGRILRDFRRSSVYLSPWRIALEAVQSTLINGVELRRPSLEIGVSEGVASAIVHSGRRRLDWGGDMPRRSTFESFGLDVPPQYAVHDRLIGMDGTQIPFADGTFATVIASQVLDYGMDRRAIFSEMMRVLMPGGRLIVTALTPLIRRYPGSYRALASKVPGVRRLWSGDRYARTLRGLGAASVTVRPFIPEPVGAALISFLYVAEILDDNPAAHIADKAWRDRIYAEGLEGLTAALEADVAGPAWFSFVTARKPGTLPRRRPTPEPVCLSCRGGAFESTLVSRTCRGCAKTYPTLFGVPMFLSDIRRTYSPDRGGAGRPIRQEEWVGIFERFARRVAGRRVAIAGVGERARLALAVLRSCGIHVVGFQSNDSECRGRTFEGLPIRRRFAGAIVLETAQGKPRIGRS